MQLKTYAQNNRWYIVSGAAMAIAYFVMRMANLVDLPIFTDEAIYIRWAQIGSQDPNWRFISLTDGKQPLYVWAVMVTVRIFSDPLFAGRIISVMTGFFSLLGIGLLAGTLFKNKQIGFIASLLYLTSPFSFMYDRLALMDSMVALFSIWSLYLAVLTVRTVRLDAALLLGMSLGGGILTKTSGFLSIYLLPVTLFLFDFRQKKWRFGLIKIIGLFGISFIISQMMYGVLRLSPWFHMISQKDSTFVELPSSASFPAIFEWYDYRTRFFIGNIRALIEWTGGYLTLPICLFIVGSVVLIKKNWREKTLLFIWSVIPLMTLAFAGKVLYPRFILFMAMPFLILSAWQIDYIFRRLIRARSYQLLALALIVSYPLYVQTKLIFSILTAPIPQADVNQYISDQYSGWGIREVNSRLEQLAQEEDITVYTDGTFGLLPYGIEIYLITNLHIKIIGIWPAPLTYTDEMLSEIRKQPTYFVANELKEIPADWNAELIDQWQKGLRENRTLRLYRLYEQAPVIPYNTNASDNPTY